MIPIPYYNYYHQNYLHQNNNSQQQQQPDRQQQLPSLVIPDPSSSSSPESTTTTTNHLPSFQSFNTNTTTNNNFYQQNYCNNPQSVANSSIHQRKLSAPVFVTNYSPVSPTNLPTTTTTSNTTASQYFPPQPYSIQQNFTYPSITNLQQPPHQHQQQHQHQQKSMKPTKVIKSHSRKSSLTTTDNMVSKFSTKSKSKKPKRNHTLIPNNSINYPIHQISSSNDTVLSTHEKEYLNNLIYPKLEIKKYSTSALDPQRNYITAYEYPVNNLWIIWDYETGWVHLTGIWKASLNIEESNVSPSHMKADIVKLLESTPKEYQHYIKRIRGGFLKIQGTWLPYKLCKILARRFCYYIRHALIPIFGVDFPDSCLKPNEKGFGELKLDDLHCFHKSELPIPVSPIQQPAIEKEQQQQQPPPQQQISSSSLPPVGSILPLPQTSPNPQLNTGSFALSNQVPSTPPRRHYSSSSSISSISSSLFSGERITPISAENTGLEIPSFNEMIDIVNASKCLQTLSRDATSPRYMKQESKDTEKTGISAILLAAGLSDVRKNEIIGSPQSDSTVKSINDLLT